MDNKLSVLKEAELLGQQFKVYGSVEEPLFVAKDVCSLLELSNVSDMVSRVDEDERTKLNLGRQGDTWMLTENGLYESLMQSRKPIAKTFKKEVKKMLKEVRLNGGYLATRGNETPEEIMAKALIVANATLERIEKERKELEEQNKRLIHSTKTYTTGELAKELGLKSAIALNKLLADNGIQYKQNSVWLLYSKYADKGYTSIKQIVLEESNKAIYDRRWTGLGRDFILSKFSNL